MFCCFNCFSSATLRSIIAEKGVSGNCDICNSQGALCVPIDALKTVFGKFLTFYGQSPIMILFGSTQQSETDNLAAVMERDGLCFFSNKLGIVQKNIFLDALLADPRRPATGYWHSALERRIYFGLNGWQAFSASIQQKRRFIVDTSDLFLELLLETKNPCFNEQIIEGAEFYRARLHDHDHEHAFLPPETLGAPPSNKSTAGRANASGIPVLYAASTPNTALAEIRPFAGAIVSIAKCRAKQDLRIFNLSTLPNLGGLDPFSNQFDNEIRAAILASELNRAFAEPVAPFTPERDYAPTQYVAEAIASAGYDGLKYRSALEKSGFNYVFFSPKDLSVSYHASVKVASVNVTSEPYDPAHLGKALESLRSQIKKKNTSR